MKLIILAAGTGSRLSKYTKSIPKGLLKFKNKALIQHNIDNFRFFGIDKIIIIKGYLSSRINFNGTTSFINKNYRSTNMVESLMCAEAELTEPCIVLYSDIILSRKSIGLLVKSEFDIGVTVDVDFQDYWEARLGKDYGEDMESLKIVDNKIVEIGRPGYDFDEVDGRYVGALKFSSKGIKSFKKSYHYSKSKNEYNDEGNRPAKKWHMTDMLQKLILEGFQINPIKIKKGWLEFDTDKDYELYNTWSGDELKEFIDI